MRYPAAPMRRPAIPLLALLAGCNQPPATATDSETTASNPGTTASPDTGDGLVPGPRIERATASTTPGGTLFVQTDVAIAEVELRLAGTLLADPPLLVGGGWNGLGGGLFAVPGDQPFGDAELRVRSRGAAADSDVVTVSIAAPIFRDVAAATGLPMLPT